MKTKKEKNLPPGQDGIHDPEGEAASMLQPPKEAFSGMVKGKAGNYVDWVKSLKQGKINPRYDRLDPNAKPIIMDLNIVREVKGSMPDVVYPHAQHTEWLDCSNCHPAIFIPQKGANQISMASILLGNLPNLSLKTKGDQDKGQKTGEEMRAALSGFTMLLFSRRRTLLELRI